MPFTGAHVAAVLPFTRWALPPSALVIGSVVPDLPLYMPTPYSAAFSHQFAGAITVDAAAGLVILALWLTLVRPVVVLYAPTSLRRRITDPATIPPLRFVPAMVLGSCTHIIWDAFTHANGWGVRRIPALTARSGALPAFEWAQYASSLVGGTILLWWCVRWWRNTPEVDNAATEHQPTPGRTIAYTLITAGVTAGAAFGIWDGLHQPDPVRSALFHATTKGIDIGGLVVLSLGITHRIRRLRQHQTRPADASKRMCSCPRERRNKGGHTQRD
ncbi:MAG TPA: DUF4184 family protein [Kribbellaceae bacterium]|nr:DUF4184 family protein [Kribbellaceae bacterium]